jgi:hypothetical protein
MTRGVHLPQCGGDGSVTSIGNVKWNLGNRFRSLTQLRQQPSRLPEGLSHGNEYDN